MRIHNYSIKKRYDIFYLGWFFVLFYYLVIAGTTLNNMIPGSIFIKWIIIGISLFLWILKIFKDKYKPNVFFLIALLISVMTLVTICSGKEILLVTCVFIIAGKDINIKKFVGFDAKLRLYAILLIAMMSLLKIIPNLVFEKEGFIKYSFGWQSANTLASNVVIVLLELMYLKWDNFKTYHWIIVILVMIFLSKYVAARASILTFVMIALWFILVRRKNRSQFFRRKLGYIYGLPYIIGTFISYTLVYIYNQYTPLSITLDNLFTHRLYFSSSYIARYGFSLFGQKLELVSSLKARLTGTNYTGVDMSYVLMPIQYGVLYFLGFLVIFSFMSYKLYKYERYPELMFLLFFAITGVTSNVMILFYRNFTIIFIWIIFSEAKKAKIPNADKMIKNGYRH